MVWKSVLSFVRYSGEDSSRAFLMHPSICRSEIHVRLSIQISDHMVGRGIIQRTSSYSHKSRYLFNNLLYLDLQYPRMVSNISPLSYRHILRVWEKSLSASFAKSWIMESGLRIQICSCKLLKPYINNPTVPERKGPFSIISRIWLGKPVEFLKGSPSLSKSLSTRPLDLRTSKWILSCLPVSRSLVLCFWEKFNHCRRYCVNYWSSA
jgi:hypothetical protein